MLTVFALPTAGPVGVAGAGLEGWSAIISLETFNITPLVFVRAPEDKMRARKRRKTNFRI